ncbi:LLM class flavin-dependent oxidoreductase [Nocardia sp. NPDC057455]|uniref:LLM class flavin-dependent oxidoreductase n=1 Tax=Nocardia sp. NPDC057455 TaxID=3346138 RepID=UPI0036715F3F
MSMTFGIVLTPRSGAAWAREAAAVERQGYRTLLLPDTRFTPSPFPVLAAAAAVTTSIRLRPNVLAAPLRTPAATAREPQGPAPRRRNWPSWSTPSSVTRVPVPAPPPGYEEARAHRYGRHGLLRLRLTRPRQPRWSLPSRRSARLPASLRSAPWSASPYRRR